MQRLLISVRGKNEAIEACKGGAHIIDAEYPGSALGTPYPLNVLAIKENIPKNTPVSTNIGEKQYVWSTASQAALGVALAGADIIKVGLAELKLKQAAYVMKNVIRNVHKWFPSKIMIPTFFADPDKCEIFDPINEGPELAEIVKADGVLIDTFDKTIGKTLLDYLNLKEIKKFAKACHKLELEAWIAGSATKDKLPDLWATGVDVICIRAAACKKPTDGKARMGRVDKELVADLIKTIP